MTPVSPPAPVPVPVPVPEGERTSTSTSTESPSTSTSTKSPSEAPVVSDRPSLIKEALFLGSHFLAVWGVYVVGVSWKLVGLAVFSYFLRMFFITAGYHRYFAHRSFKTSRAFQLVLAFGGALASQKGAIWWASHHRHHHKFSDMPEDVHSPTQRGFWWAHMGWILSPRFKKARLELIADFTRFPELMLLNRFWLVPPLTGLAGLYVVGGLPFAVWGGLVSTVVLWHGTFTINSLAHVFGRRRYATGDTSRNSMILALITMGEGWHNNHHRYMAAANQGFRWWEIDVTFEILRVLSWTGLIWNVKRPPEDVLEEGRRPLAAS